MEQDFSQDKPKLILTYPHKSKFNTIGLLSMAAVSFIVLGLLKHLISHDTDLSGIFIIAIALIAAPLDIWFMGYYLFINGTKLEIYENNVAKYYTCRVHSVDTKSEIVKILHFKQFYKHYVFVEDGEGGRKKVLKNYIDVNVCIDMVCGDTKYELGSEE